MDTFQDFKNNSDFGDSTLSLVNNITSNVGFTPRTVPSNSTKVEFISFFVLSRVCDILNCWTVAVIFKSKRIRRVNYLIANLSLACLLLSVACTIYVGERVSVLQQFKGVYICRFMSYARNVFVAVISFSVFAISYERIHSLKTKSTRDRLLIKRTLLAIWGLAMVLMSPTLTTRVYFHQPPAREKCKTSLVLGRVELSIAFEIVRFCTLHVSVCCYMVFELYKIRSKLRYLYLFRVIPSRKLLKKIRRVRFVYIFSISFISLWFPTGGVMSFVVMQHRQPSIEKKVDLTVPFLVSVYLYLMIVPVSILITNDDMAKLTSKFFGSCCPNWTRRDAVEQKGQGARESCYISGVTDQAETFEMTPGPSSGKNDTVTITIENVDEGKDAEMALGQQPIIHQAQDISYLHVEYETSSQRRRSGQKDFEAEEMEIYV